MNIELHPNFMIKQLAIFIFLLFGFINSTAQKIGEDYYAIPTDNGQLFLLKFLSDSTLEVRNEYKHLTSIPKRVFYYIKTDTTLTLLQNKRI
jgi:hypothetical protein